MSTNGLGQDGTDELLSLAKDVEKLGETILRAAEGRRELPAPLGETLKQIADLAVACEEFVTEPSTDSFSQASRDTLATALAAIRSGIDGLVVFQALQGTTYSTTTVAND
jgi:hypothetical protein